MSFQYSADFKPDPSRLIDVAELKDRIARRRQQLAVVTAEPPPPACAEALSPAQAVPLVPRTTYEIGHFAEHDGRVFIENVYRLVLGREPDPAGMMGYLRRLESGDHKTLILGDIRYSPEGRARGVRIRNLRSRHAFYALTRKRVLGRLIHILFHLMRLPDLAREQRAQKLRLEETAQRAEMAAHQRDEALRRMEARLADVHGHLLHVEERFGGDTTRIDAHFSQQLGQVRDAVEKAASTAERGIDRQTFATDTRIAHLSARIADLEDRLLEFDRNPRPVPARSKTQSR